MGSLKLSARRRSWMGLPLFLSFFLALMLVTSSLQGTWDVAYASDCGVGTNTLIGGTGTGTGTVGTGTNIGGTAGSVTFRATIEVSPSSVDVGATSTLTATVLRLVGSTPSTAIAGVDVRFTTNLGTLSSTTTVPTDSAGKATATLSSSMAGTATVHANVYDDSGNKKACPDAAVTFVAVPVPGGGGGGAAPAPAAAPVAPPVVEPTAVPSPAPVTQTVAPTGGTVSVGGGAATDGGVSLDVPPGALAAPVAIKVEISAGPPSGVQPPAGTVFLDKTIEITPSQATTLGGAVTMTVNLTEQDLKGKPIGSVGIGRVKPDGTVEPLPTRVRDAARGIVEVDIDHFSKFTLFALVKPVPTLTDPVDRAILPGLGRVLTWTNPPDTKWFQIQVIPFNNDGPGIDLIIGDTALVKAAQYEVKAPNFGGAAPNYVMLPGITYTWRVRATTTTTAPTEADWSAWALRTFRTTMVGSYSMALQSPADQSVVESNRPIVTWVNSDRQVFYYEVQVSADPTFSTGAGASPLYWEVVHGGVSTPANSYTIPSSRPLQSGTTYYWRVRPRIQGDGVPVGWTVPQSFTTP